MKKNITTMFRLQSMAGDLIYKNGFENNRLVSGTASVLISAG